MALKGVYLNFNGYGINNWPGFNTAYPIFQKVYPGWKCTYNPDNWDNVSTTHKNQMLAAQATGITFGMHGGLDAIPVNTFLETGTADQYYTNQVKANYDLMIADGVLSGKEIQLPTGEAERAAINTFGTKTDGINLWFKKTGGIFADPAQSNCYMSNFFKQGNIWVGKVEANVDRERGTFDHAYLKRQLEYARDNNDVLVITGHNLLPDGGSTALPLSTLYSTIHLISRFVCCNGLSFYTAEEVIAGLEAGQYGSERNFPYVSLITITGTQSVGNNLTATYTYADDDDTAESGTTVQWYRADDASGINAAAISGATSLVYTLVAGDSGKYVRIGITPRATGQTGYETFSKWLAIS